MTKLLTNLSGQTKKRSGRGLAGKLSGLIGVLLLGSLTEIAFAQAPLLKDDFETEKLEWAGLGTSAKVERVTGAGKTKGGAGALQFRYRVEGKKSATTKPETTEAAEIKKDKPQPTAPFDILFRAVSVGQLAKMNALKFSVKTEIDTPLVVTMTEKDGGRYLTMLWIPKGEWQEVTVTPDECWLADDKDDPKDPDGKLDPDKIENIALADLSCVFAPELSAQENGGIPVSSLHLGEHTILIDDFMVSGGSPLTPKRDELAIDPFNQDLLRWFALGDVQMRLDKASPLKTPAFRADYKQGDGGYVLFVKNTRGMKATSADSLVLDLASTKSCRLIFMLEEKNGSKYSFTLAVPGDSEPYHRVVEFSEFAAAEGVKDDNDRLDPLQVKTLTITDVLGAYGIAKQKNTLWIGPIRLQPAPPK